MPEMVVCPVCGETNPADMEFCRNCQSRLRPLTGTLRGEDAPIQPGEPPTKKVTSELEPLLPQWLRDARQQARESTAGEASKSGDEEPDSLPSGSDLLAGLESQSRDEEDEVPEWLAHITGTASKKKQSVPDENQVKWVELGRRDETPESPAEPTSPVRPPPDVPGSEKDELRDWFKQAAASSETADFRLPPAPPDNEPISPAPEESHRGPEPPSQPEAENLEWLRSLDAAASAKTRQPVEETPPAREEVPDWLKQLQAEQTPPEVSQPPQEPSIQFQGEVPDWLKPFGEEVPATAAPAPPSQEPPVLHQPLPDWLKPAESEADAHEAAPSSSTPEADNIPTETPDWIAALRGAESYTSTPAQSAEQPFEPEPTPQPVEPELPAPEAPSTAAAFTGEAISGEDVDAIFASMQTPDWLSSVIPGQTPVEESAPAAAQEEQAIGPAELPSWVQAMRPVESAIAAASGAAEETPTEEKGPLAGLHGVLPSIPGAVVPSSKPKAHSIKLDATEQQQAHAALLEQILAAETSPIPMKSGALLRSARALRWAISVLMILLVAVLVVSGTHIFPLPAAVPIETMGAIRAMQGIPSDAPVLLVFDYQPSTVGEMEATGSSLLENLLLLKHPRIALLSTSPTGPALAERFMSTAMPDLPQIYQRDVQYVDLGYLPGGVAGVYNFAQNPSVTVPLDANSKPAWQSPVLSAVSRFSDFAAIIVLTDSVEAGRSWIEQTSTSRGNSLMILISSAQAGPMLLPYADSGQVNGMVSGMNGAAGAEQANAGLPGMVRRYWDAYSLGLYLAVFLIVLGGLWNLRLGIRDRREQAVG